LAGLLAAPHSRASIVASSDFTQDDLAVIHVGLSDTPSIQLDRSADVAVEDPLAIIGFPGNGDFSSDPTALLTVSVNNATVSAIKKNDNGSALIQIGGNVEHGDSGGPALNAAGHIIGIVSFGGTETPGITSFLRSSDSAQALISHAGITTTPGAFQRAWERAFGEYAATTASHWHQATRDLQALHANYPEFQGMLPYLRYAEIQAGQESTITLPPAVGSLPTLALIGGGAVLLALLLAGAVALGVRARRRRALRAARIPQPAMAMVPAGAYAPPTQPGSYGYQGYPAPPYPPPPAGMAPPYSPTPYGAAPSGPVSPYPGGPSGLAGPWSGPHAPPAPGAPGTATPPAAMGAPSGGMPNLCLNGHLLPTGVVTCGICGAPRRSGTSQT
ncbi:MAG TPA: serine protease, partial [Ktedonobacterales bacterium]